jgi:hypothetical protein
MNDKMFALVGTELPQVHLDDVPAAYRAIAEEGWIVGRHGAYLLAALGEGYHGFSAAQFDDIVHLEASVNGRGMMDYDLPDSGPERLYPLLRRSIAYACLVLKLAPADDEHKILGYVSLSEGGMSDDVLTAHVTFCTRRSGVPPYINNVQDYAEESLLELCRDDAVRMLN